MKISKSVSYHTDLLPEAITAKLNEVSHQRLKVQRASVEKEMFFVYNRPISSESFRLSMKHYYTQTRVCPHLQGTITPTESGSEVHIFYHLDLTSKLYLLIPIGICVGAFFSPFTGPLILLALCAFLVFYALLSWGFKGKSSECEAYITELLELKVSSN